MAYTTHLWQMIGDGEFYCFTHIHCLIDHLLMIKILYIFIVKYYDVLFSINYQH